MVNSGIPKQRGFRFMASDQSCQELLANLNPTLCPDPWVFSLVAGGAPQLPEDRSVFALIREEEGLTAIRRAAPSDDPETLPLFARITLQVYSDLEAVGLTAAVSGALAGQNLCANMVAGLNHDHLFVPYQQRDEALQCLKQIAAEARAEKP